MHARDRRSTASSPATGMFWPWRQTISGTLLHELGLLCQFMVDRRISSSRRSASANNCSIRYAVPEPCGPDPDGCPAQIRKGAKGVAGGAEQQQRLGRREPAEEFEPRLGWHRRAVLDE